MQLQCNKTKGQRERDAEVDWSRSRGAKRVPEIGEYIDEASLATKVIAATDAEAESMVMIVLKLKAALMSCYL